MKKKRKGIRPQKKNDPDDNDEVNTTSQVQQMHCIPSFNKRPLQSIKFIDCCQEYRKIVLFNYF